MTTFHMETDTVRGMANQLRRTAEQMQTQVQSLNGSVQNMDWIGPNRDEFVTETRRIIQAIQIQVETGLILAQRSETEVSEWELVAKTNADHYRTTMTQLASIWTVATALSTSIGAAGGGQNLPISAWAYVTEIPPRNYAIFSELAYSDSPTLPQELKDQGWEVLCTATDEGFTKEGYAATVFINQKTGEVVIAHRGTDTWTLNKNLTSDFDDDLALVQGKLPDQYNVSREFVSSVKEKLSKDPRFSNYTLVHTGHSLGAALSDLNAMKDGCKGIGFDNPGTYQIVQNNFSEFQSARENQKNIISYQSNPNLVHLGGQNLGHIVDIVPADGSTKPPNTLIGALLQTSKHHSIQNIVNSMSSETNYPTGYFPPTAGEINHGFHNLNQVNQGKVDGVIQVPMCFPPKELPYLPEYIDTLPASSHNDIA